MDNLIIVVMALGLFAILLLILLYISIKRHYNEKHLSEDYDIDVGQDEVIEDPEIEIVRILIDNNTCIFEANGYFLTDGESVRPLYNGEYVDGVVIESNSRVKLSSLDAIPALLQLEVETLESNETLKSDYDVVVPKVKRYADEDKISAFDDEFDVVIPTFEKEPVSASTEKTSVNSEDIDLMPKDNENTN